MPAIKERTEAYVLIRAEKYQKTREDVARKTLEHLAEEPLSESIAVPSEDFMRSFDCAVEKAASEEIQNMMARILAGEIRKPGSISRATLRMSEILDREIIEAMLLAKPFLVENKYLLSDSFNLTDSKESVELLSSVGILTVVESKEYNFDSEGIAFHSYPSGVVGVQKKLPYPTTGTFCHLTRSGRELFELLPEGKSISVKDIAENYRKSGKFAVVITGTKHIENGKVSFVEDSS